MKSKILDHENGLIVLQWSHNPYAQERALKTKKTRSNHREFRNSLRLDNLVKFIKCLKKLRKMSILQKNQTF